MEDEQPGLPERVRISRVERGWSKEEAARQAGISAITWKRIEDGLNVHDGKLSAAMQALGLSALPAGVRRVGDPEDDLVEFEITGNFGVRAVVKGPVRDIDEMQAAVSKLISGMQVEAERKSETT